MRPESGFRIARNRSQIGKMSYVTIFQHDVIVNFFDIVLFLLSSFVTGPSSMSISSPVLELWQFSFIMDWAEIRKSEIPQSEFCPISGDWGKSGIPNLTRMSLIKCYWMLQNTRVSFTTTLRFLPFLKGSFLKSIGSS